MMPSLRCKRGFTLIELIISLVIIAIMGTMLTSYVRTATLHSADPVVVFRNRSRLHSDMEKINSEYKKRIHKNNFSQEDFIENVLKGVDSYQSSEEITLNPKEAPMLLVTLKKGDQEVIALYAR